LSKYRVEWLRQAFDYREDIGNRTGRKAGNFTAEMGGMSTCI
jgi:hypothetical protein